MLPRLPTAGPVDNVAGRTGAAELVRPPRTSLRDLVLLALISLGAFFVHGFHPAAEDAAIYLPGIKKLLNPALYPYNDQFFAAHASRTLFPKLIAASVQVSHVPFDSAILCWHLLSIFLLLLACWQIANHCFADAPARWGAALLVAATLTVPVAGTALFILDPYLNPRSLSAPAILFALVNTLERRYLWAVVWLAATALIHPLMVVFGVSYLLALHLPVLRKELLKTLALALVPVGLMLPGLAQVGEGYRDSLNIPAHSFFFLGRWQWYEWVGIFAPIALLFSYRNIARRRSWQTLEQLTSALVVYGCMFFVAAVVITIPKSMTAWVFLQPMRSLHLLYILFFLFTGGMLGEFVLRRQVWRWVVLFAPLCGIMYFVQRQTFPATPHVEWPGRVPANDWLQAFAWIRENTPQDAYFALDPDHMNSPGEDEHGFRAMAERSMLADRVKDSGAVTMFPRMADEWRRQAAAQAGWKTFQKADFERLRQEFGVTWVIIQSTGSTGLACVYQNPTLKVCHLD
jgi:hypothetical protein